VLPSPLCRDASEDGLLDLDLGAGGLELGLDILGFVLGHAFLDWLGGGVDEVLGFLEAQAVMARTSLMTLIGVAPLALRMTSNVVFSSAGAAAAAPPAAATATGAAAETPHLVSRSFHEVSDVQNGLGAEPLDDLVFGDVAHGILVP